MKFLTKQCKSISIATAMLAWAWTASAASPAHTPAPPAHAPAHAASPAPAAASVPAKLGGTALMVQPGLWRVIYTVHNGTFTENPGLITHCFTEKDIGDFANRVVETQYTPHPPDDVCKRTSYKETVNSVSWKTECTGKFAFVSEGSVSFDSTSHYKGSIKLKGKAGENNVDSVIVLEGNRRHGCIASLHN